MNPDSVNSFGVIGRLGGGVKMDSVSAPRGVEVVRPTLSQAHSLLVELGGNLQSAIDRAETVARQLGGPDDTASSPSCYPESSGIAGTFVSIGSSLLRQANELHHRLAQIECSLGLNDGNTRL